MNWRLGVATILFAFVAGARGQSVTLRSELRNDGLPLDVPASVPNLDQKITSGGELDTPEQFVFAYYLDGNGRSLNPPMFVVRYDRKAKTWQSGTIAKAAPAGEDSAAECLGAVLDVRSFGEGFVVETHINPSAGCALILTKELTLDTSLYGWVLETFTDGVLIYHRSQVHFATVHAAEIAVFDSRDKKQFTIFPPKEQTPIREKLSGELKSFFQSHQDYCAKNNDPCDAQQFDSALDGKVHVDDREHAIVFAVSYRLQGYGQDDQGKPEGPGRVIYVYRHANDEAKVEVRELLPAEIKTKFGDVGLQELTDPERLKTIFQK